MRTREEEYLRRMKALGYEPDLRGMDDDDIEWELSKMEKNDRRREAEWQQPLRTIYRPVDPGLKARILRMFGQPYDASAIPEGQKFYLNGWDNGEDEKPLSLSNSKNRGLNVRVDPLGMFPQYESGETTSNEANGNGSVDSYRNSEMVPRVVDGATKKEDEQSKSENEDSSFGDKVHNIGKKQLGLPYVLGGDGVSSTDCGKFTLDTYKKIGTNLGSRVAPDQYEFCKTNGSVFKEQSQARPGDLVFFKDTYDSGDGPGSITHVGIYVGDGKMLHAGSSKGVSYADLNSEYWQSHFYGFGRPRR